MVITSDFKAVTSLSDMKTSFSPACCRRSGGKSEENRSWRPVNESGEWREVTYSQVEEEICTAWPGSRSILLVC